MTTKLQSLHGLKFNPFRPDVPVEALHTTPLVDVRVRLGDVVVRPHRCSPAPTKALCDDGGHPSVEGARVGLGVCSS